MELGGVPTLRQAKQDLTKVPAFGLGPITIDPPACRLTSGSRIETIEPRVMRVLVTLGQLPGTVFSRDDLIEQCWDGLIVGENAIHRVVSRLRHLLSDLSDGAVQVETITRVGFRIVVDGAEQASADFSRTAPAKAMEAKAAAPTAQPRKWTRRAAIAGAVLTGSALVYVGVNRAVPAGPDPRARKLYEQGQFLLKTGEVGTVRQAIDFYKQAVTIDPNYADAWGALAVGYIHNLDSVGPRARVAAPELARSAAERALSLDPDQPDAQLALAIPLPHFRRWLEHEKRLRDIVGRYPDYWYGHAQLGILLLDVGRAGEAVERYRRVLEIEPMLPNYWARFAAALHFAGREQEADIAFDEALARWPTNGFLRPNLAGMYMDSKRYAESIAFLRDTRNYPEGASGAPERGLRWAEALASGTGFAEHIEYVRGRLARAESPDLTFLATVLLRFGAVDLAFDVLEAVYFGGVVDGRRIAPPAATDRRGTVSLFGNAMLEHRDDPRYVSILQRTGLEDYWRKSGTQPDYRKR